MSRVAAERWNLLGLDGMPAEEIGSLLDEAEGELDAAEGRASSRAGAGRIVANLFFEDSTRTRCGFTVAAHRIGASVVDLAGAGSSLSKGETLLDTALNIEAMGVDVLVIRSSAAGVPAQIARAVRCPVINAGDGRHEHPTQALLDLLTLRRRWGGLAGRTVAIVGDIANSRVARSNVFGLTALGADVVLVGPPALVPEVMTRIASGPGRVEIGIAFDEVLERVDAVMMLRIQLERHERGEMPEDYRQHYGLTVERARALRPDALVMHPGPMNRGVEIDAEVADDPRHSVILEQVGNGVAVRMAVLKRALA